MNAEAHFDASHGGTGSIRHACSTAGLSCQFVLALISCNAPLGDWKDGARREQIRTVIAEATRASSHAEDAALGFVESRCSASRDSHHGNVGAVARYMRLQATGGSWEQEYLRVSSAKHFGLRERFVLVERQYWRERLYGGYSSRPLFAGLGRAAWTAPSGLPPRLQVATLPASERRSCWGRRRASSLQR